MRITNFNMNWNEIKEACMTTISKEATGKEPSIEWKKKLILAEHSPLRRGTITVKWDSIPYFVSTHLVRHHIGVEKFVGTSREDRTGIPRDQRKQTDMVCMEMDMNPQALINISRKRLCYQADKTTRQYWEEVVDEVGKYDEVLKWGCVPECVRDGGCPEFRSCGLYDRFSQELTEEEQKSLVKRYDKYNEWRGK